MKEYKSVDAMVKDLGSEEFYRNWKRPSWHKFKNWCWLQWTVYKKDIRYIGCWLIGHKYELWRTDGHFKIYVCDKCNDMKYNENRKG